MISIGQIIRINREKLGYTQEYLCYGVCTTANLSKIENGERIPTRGTFEALMQKMGMSSEVYPSFLNDKDKRAYELQHDFNEEYAKGEYDKAEKTLDELDALPKSDKVYEQFSVMSRVLVAQQKGMTPEEAVKRFEEIINIYLKDFSVDKIRRLALTKTEINLLNAYAIACHRADIKELAIKILYEIVTYIEGKVYDREGITIVYTKILYNLSKYVGMSGDDEECIRLCDIGIKLCIRYSRHVYFANLLYNKGYSLINLGKMDEASKCIQESYYIARAMDYDTELDLGIIKRLATKHGIKLV